MILKKFVVGPFETNNYLIMDEVTKEAALIDCSEYSRDIINAVKELGAKVKYILLTHWHFDHVLGVNDMKEPLGGEVLIHENDVEQLKNTNHVLSMLGLKSATTPQHDGLVQGDLNIGNIVIKPIHTPGHSRGGLCYLVEDKLFSGDTLFLDCVGRIDLPGGDLQDIRDSVTNVLFKLDDNIIVYPGHGPQTTIGYEKLHNEVL